MVDEVSGVPATLLAPDLLSPINPGETRLINYTASFDDGTNRTNEVIKVLTIVATTFIPLTFLAGIYGMNFEYMPELGWKYSYLSFWILILLLTVTMIMYFRRKKWF